MHGTSTASCPDGCRQQPPGHGGAGFLAAAPSTGADPAPGPDRTGPGRAGPRPGPRLGGDAAAEVAKLGERPGRELQVRGSGQLAQTLIDHDLVDEYRLLYFSVHLGSGKKLFRDGARGAALRLLHATTTSTGVIVTTYEPAGPARYGSCAPDQQ